MLYTPYPALPHSITELFARSMYTGQLTLSDRDNLRQVLLDDSATDEELQVIDRILYAVRRGKLDVI